MKNLKKIGSSILFFLKKNGEFEAHDDAKKIYDFIFNRNVFIL